MALSTCAFKTEDILVPPRLIRSCYLVPPDYTSSTVHLLVYDESDLVNTVNLPRGDILSIQLLSVISDDAVDLFVDKFRQNWWPKLQMLYIGGISTTLLECVVSAVRDGAGSNLKAIYTSYWCTDDVRDLVTSLADTSVCPNLSQCVILSPPLEPDLVEACNRLKELRNLQVFCTDNTCHYTVHEGFSKCFLFRVEYGDLRDVEDFVAMHPIVADNDITTLLAAIKRGNKEILGFLIKLFDTKTINTRSSELHAATSPGKQDVTKILLDHGARV